MTIAVLGVVALIAGYLPARRALLIDPMRALRAELNPGSRVAVCGSQFAQPQGGVSDSRIYGFTDSRIERIRIEGIERIGRIEWIEWIGRIPDWPDEGFPIRDEGFIFWCPASPLNGNSHTPGIGRTSAAALPIWRRRARDRCRTSGTQAKFVSCWSRCPYGSKSIPARERHPQAGFTANTKSVVPFRRNAAQTWHTDSRLASVSILIPSVAAASPVPGRSMVSMWLQILFAVGTLSQSRATLASESARRGLTPPPGAEDLERHLTDYQVLDDADGFVIAYSIVENNRLHELRIRAFDKRTGRWRYAAHEEIGSVLQINRGAGFLFVTGHSSPSAAPTLVFDADLKLRRTLDGWTMLVLEDGRLIFERSMVHFAPAHAAILAVYDPRTNIERTFYPAAGRNNDRGFELVAADRAVDRSVSKIEAVPPHHIAFTVVTQAMDVSSPIAIAAGPEQRLRVTCDIAGKTPVCVEDQGAVR